ncbi:MAG: FtsB family cell division protein [Candidatus Omnitrophota bacterium]
MKRFLFFFAIVGVLIALVIWVYLPPLTRYRDLKQEEERILRQIAALDKKIESLEEERDLLKNDVHYIEKVIREELGLVKPGEIVYRFVTQKPGEIADGASSSVPAAGPAPETNPPPEDKASELKSSAPVS